MTVERLIGENGIVGQMRVKPECGVRAHREEIMTSQESITRKATFVGGVRYGMRNFTVPLVRLELFEDRLLVHSNFRLLRRFVPKVEVTYGEISIIRPVAAWLGSGVRISVRGPGDSVIFWTWSPNAVLAAMKARGLQINPEKTRFHFTDPER